MGKGRAPCCDKSKVKRGPWSVEEDLRLTGFIQKNGHSNWRALPKLAGLLRCGKSCRLRWINYLRPDVKRGNFTSQEEQTIINLHISIGNKWSKIASYLPGRTDNEIKNVWNTHLKKRLTRKHSNTKSDSQKNGADDSEMDYSGSPSCTSSSITVSGSDPNMGKAQIDQESEIKKTEPKETTNSDSGQNQEPGFSKSEIINQESYEGNEKIEIPFDSDIDLWELLDSLDPLQEQNGEIQSSNLEKFDCEVECSNWLRLLEDELELTTDSDNMPNQKHLEMDLEPEIGHELDYIPILNGSSENLSI